MPPDGRATLRIATYNIAWFTALFDDRGRMLEDRAPSRRHGITRADQLAAIGIVLTALDADAVLVVEAPDAGQGGRAIVALEGFAAATGLRARRALMGFPSDTEQEIALLYDPDRLTPRHDPRGGGADAPRFDATFRVDLDLDGQSDVIRFSRPPLELAVETPHGRGFRLIGVHAKSKAVHGARGDGAHLRIGIENRRKQLAQCLWLRRRVEEHLAAGDPLVVLGDLNDGPGLDAFEALFGRSGVEVVLGGDDPATRLIDPNATFARRASGLQPSTARFWVGADDALGDRTLPALLDYIMVSPDLAARGPRWRIWHPFDDPAAWAVPDLRDALLTASDHFPVTLDLPL